MPLSMQVEQLNEGVWALTYLVIDESTQQAALIDPVYDYMDHYAEVISQKGIKLQFLIATHTHADHITACFEMAKIYDCDYVMWKHTASLAVTRYVDDEEKLMLGSIPISFHYVPGHTEDSMIVEVPGHLFTGDFLFNGQGGVGRDDLPSGRIDRHWDSLDVLNRFADDMLVCSGHEPPGTQCQTLGWNRQHNPILQMNSIDEYTKWQHSTSASLGYVSKIKTAVPANLFAEIPEVIPWLQ